jgi:hypothetical protein
MVTAQVPLLRTLQQLIGDSERLVAARVVAYPRTWVLADLPCVGMINLGSAADRGRPDLGSGRQR